MIHNEKVHTQWQTCKVMDGFGLCPFQQYVKSCQDYGTVNMKDSVQAVQAHNMETKKAKQEN